jgi:hypothetical protein
MTHEAKPDLALRVKSAEPWIAVHWKARGIEAKPMATFTDVGGSLHANFTRRQPRAMPNMSPCPTAWKAFN